MTTIGLDDNTQTQTPTHMRTSQQASTIRVSVCVRVSPVFCTWKTTHDRNSDRTTTTSSTTLIWSGRSDGSALSKWTSSRTERSATAPTSSRSKTAIDIRISFNTKHVLLCISRIACFFSSRCDLWKLSQQLGPITEIFEYLQNTKTLFGAFRKRANQHSTHSYMNIHHRANNLQRNRRSLFYTHCTRRERQRCANWIHT